MAKLCYLVFLSLLSCSMVNAQVPKYFIRDPGNGALYNFGLTSPVPAGSGKIQSIYLPTDFPGAPTGMMTNMFIRVTSGGGTTADFEIKIGYTTKIKFATNAGSKNDTFITNLYTVFRRPGYIIPKTDTNGTWIKIKLEEGNFLYDRTKNFAVEWALGPPLFGNAFCLYVHHSRPQTSLAGPRDSLLSQSSWSGIDFGFDIATTGMDHMTNITSFGLFPNPAVDGRFNVSFDAKQPVADVLISVFSLTGELVLSKSYSAGGKSFFKEVDLNGFPKGTYAVKVVAGGESITRQQLVQ
jgi:hypothetical protein